MDSIMSAITTHVLDTSLGRPAASLPLSLEVKASGTDWKELNRAATDNDGRCKKLLPDGLTLSAGTYRLTFDTGVYFKAQQKKGFYPLVTIVFEIREVGEHYHVPLLLSPYGYSTYRGS